MKKIYFFFNCNEVSTFTSSSLDILIDIMHPVLLVWFAICDCKEMEMIIIIIITGKNSHTVI